MTCNYNLTLETYSTVSKACHDILEDSNDWTDIPEDCILADGVSRRLYAVNRNLPGPQIRVRII